MRLEGVHIAFARADADGLLEGTDEDFAIADLAGAGRGGDRFDRAVDQLASDRHFNLQLRQEAHGVFGAAIDLGVALLTAIAFDFSHRQSVDADAGERVAHLVQFERLYDRHYYFHAVTSCCASAQPWLIKPRANSSAGNRRVWRLAGGQIGPICTRNVQRARSAALADQPFLGDGGDEPPFLRVDEPARQPARA